MYVAFRLYVPTKCQAETSSNIGRKYELIFQSHTYENMLGFTSFAWNSPDNTVKVPNMHIAHAFTA